MPWNPDRYHQFQSERFAPFTDLIALVKSQGKLQVIDLGCGSGELTQRLADTLPHSQVIGLDASPQMLTRAQAQIRSNLRFKLGEIQTVTGEWDLIFSHAAIQWVEDHLSLIPRLFSLLAPNGQLVVQIPSNHHHPTHRLIIETASENPFFEALNGWKRLSPVLSIETYAELLYTSGGHNLTIFEKVYPHLLKDADALLEWNLGTALVPYLERLPNELHELFINRYRSKLWDRWSSGPVFYGFRRILFSATRSTSR
ncbi:methyltransferase domain-containing protein [Coleofasciculus sp. FACHB-1120]|uniref:methyltransferase domain-containing protein n=1 Tax=Coleofasciculus sp. FACHB-1120 TaxID=2692783 RepID=UPI00168655F6|nr:methyltransferase domain-containing protein [Coleofasciculus sp. FACHB-1120]MBD2743864.1 methyltransferase domain-containing protein [Coleofasciculus sp. FACHB-1120]